MVVPRLGSMTGDYFFPVKVHHDLRDGSLSLVREFTHHQQFSPNST